MQGPSKPLSRREAQQLVDRAVAAAATTKYAPQAVPKQTDATSAAPAPMSLVTKKLQFKKKRVLRKKTETEKSHGDAAKKGKKSRNAKKQTAVPSKVLKRTSKTTGAAAAAKMIGRKKSKKLTRIVGSDAAVAAASAAPLNDADIIRSVICGRRVTRDPREAILLSDLSHAHSNAAGTGSSSTPSSPCLNSSATPVGSVGGARHGPCAFLASYLEEKVLQTPVVDESALLKDAHDYFKTLNKKERSWNKAAMNRLKDMKRVNKQGGDKDGFCYVVPKNVKTVVQQLMVQEGVEGANIDSAQLESSFLGDGIRDTEQKPMRRHKVKNYAYDDFYQFQVAKKWTKNAESFLSRGRAGRNMFVAKQQNKRSIKKM